MEKSKKRLNRWSGGRLEVPPNKSNKGMESVMSIPNPDSERKFRCTGDEISEYGMVTYAFACCSTQKVHWRLGGSEQFKIGEVYPESKITKFFPVGEA
jgi:hypothetical protein